MPIRSSVCAYSPLAAAATNSPQGSSSKKYSTPGRFGATSSTVLPAPAAYGQYKPLGSSSGYTPGRFSASPAASVASYSPSGGAGGAGLYRPIGSASASNRSSFNASSSANAARYTPANRYSVSSSSLSSSASSDYLSPSAAAAAGNRNHLYGNQSSSAYSSASLSSASLASSSNVAVGRASYSSKQNSSSSSSPRATRRLSYTSHSSLSSIGSCTSHSSAAAEPLPDGVPSGLINLGNTCYMNASLQALFAIDALRDLLCRPGHLDASKLLTSELAGLFKRMRDSSLRRSSGGASGARSPPPISPDQFKQAFSRHQTKFSGFGQQDAQEFLRYLINGVHEESNSAASARPRHQRRSPCSGSSAAASSSPTTKDEAWAQYRAIVDDSPLVDLLVGQLCSTITCSQCQNKSHCWDPFWDLSLPLVGVRGQYASSRTRDECRLSDLLDEFTSKETLDSDERPICERCKKPTRSTKQISLARLPQVLILHLKKFSNNGVKLSRPDVQIEPELQLNDVTYKLKACISHHGYSSASGHYTSHCEYSSRWFQFDDDRVRDEGNTLKGSKLMEAYVLFYTRSRASRSPSTYL